MKFLLDFITGALSVIRPRPYSGFAKPARPVDENSHPWHIEHARRRELGSVDGRYYLYYIDVIKDLKREGRYDHAIELLLKCIDAAEREAAAFNETPPPGWYERLAIVYRKQKRFADEVAVIERYHAQTKAAGTRPGRMAERLVKARAIYEKSV